MSTFAGFPSGKVDFIRIPEQFFTDLLPIIDHAGELKISLFALWFLERQEATIRYIKYQDFIDSNLFQGMLPEQKEELIKESLTRAIKRGTLLHIQPNPETYRDSIFFLNTPRGRAARLAYEAGEWVPDHNQPLPESYTTARPTIYRLYEENIGPLTPLMADTLQEAENTYPLDWIEDAIEKAVQNNARKWRYIEAILRSWKENGRYEKNG